MMLIYELNDDVEFCPVESSRPFQRNRVQPAFRNHIFASHMDMWRFTTVKGDKEKTIRTYSQNSRHLYPASILPPRRTAFNPSSAEPIQGYLAWPPGALAFNCEFVSLFGLAPLGNFSW